MKNPVQLVLQLYTTNFDIAFEANNMQYIKVIDFGQRLFIIDLKCFSLVL